MDVTKKDGWIMDIKKSIGNVNVLNMLNATADSVAGIREIGNVNLVLYSPETAGLFHHLDMGNVNQTIEVPAGSSLVEKTGQVFINADFFKGLGKQVFLLVTGQLVIEPGLPAADIEKGLAGLAMTGTFCCPEELMGAFHAKPNFVVGQSVAYPVLKHFVKDDLALDLGFLTSLEDGAEISVIGDLRAAKVLPNDLLERKIGRIFVSGDVECHEENAGSLRMRLYKSTGEFKIIPTGYELVEKPVVLDKEMLAYLPGNKLYFKEQLLITADVIAPALEQVVEKVICEELLIAPAGIKAVLAQHCNLFETRTIFYADELWLVKDAQKLLPRRITGLRGTATLVVTGELTFDSSVTPESIAERISKVHNLGLIRCTPEQQAVLEDRLVTAEGAIVDSTEVEEPAKEQRENYIGNVNYLTL
jgi:hypothetical protein